MHTIISKRPHGLTYTNWIKVGGSMKREGTGIFIKGGAGVVGGFDLLSGKDPTSRSTDVPIGVHTYVDDNALEYLMRNPVFKCDLKKGLVFVVKDKKADQDMTNTIAQEEMIPDNQIPNRPISEEELEAAGAEFNKDGSLDITNVREGMSPLKARAEDAGATASQQKANKAKRTTKRRKKA